MDKIKDYINNWLNYDYAFLITTESQVMQTEYKEFSFTHSKITFDITPMIMIQSSQTDDYTLYTVTSLYFNFSLIHDSNGLNYDSLNNVSVELYPIKCIKGKTFKYIVPFKYETTYQILFELSPFAKKQASIVYYLS